MRLGVRGLRAPRNLSSAGQYKAKQGVRHFVHSGRGKGSKTDHFLREIEHFQLEIERFAFFFAVNVKMAQFFPESRRLRAGVKGWLTML